MKKKIDTASIKNELTDASVFFSPTSKSKETKTEEPTAPRSRGVTVSSHRDTTQPRYQEKARTTQTSSKQEATAPRTHDTMTPRNHDTNPIEKVRRAVRALGKEAATHRFTEVEKRAIADIVYTYSRQGCRTSENEITRIAINWILFDFEENGADSVIEKTMKALKS